MRNPRTCTETARASAKSRRSDARLPHNQSALRSSRGSGAGLGGKRRGVASCCHSAGCTGYRAQLPALAGQLFRWTWTTTEVDFLHGNPIKSKFAMIDQHGGPACLLFRGDRQPILTDKRVSGFLLAARACPPHHCGAGLVASVCCFARQHCWANTAGVSHATPGKESARG